MVEAIALDTDENSSIDVVISVTGNICLHVVIFPAFPNLGETNAEVPTIRNDMQINLKVATEVIILECVAGIWLVDGGKDDTDNSMFLCRKEFQNDTVCTYVRRSEYFYTYEREENDFI